MGKYINKSALVAELNRLIAELAEEGEDTMFEQGRISAFEDVKVFINHTLEVKEMDLKKEFDYNDYMNFFKEHPEYSNIDWGFDECWVFAKYFFELGLKAQKGK